MPRLFLPDTELNNRFITIRGDKARYLTRVLRCRAGDPVFLYDDKGNSYSSVITAVSSREVSAELIKKMDFHTESPLHVTLLQGLLKGEKMDLIIQKATELGVKEIVPVITERSQVRETRKMARWLKIAEEASRQAGRNTVPVIRQTTEFDELGGIPLPGGIIFWEQGGAGLDDTLKMFRHRKSISLFAGPEGGFSQSEIEAASTKGFVRATLGGRILRAETAAIAAIAITQFSLGDMGA
jgi:16S rRNA (uracil1498-N3)-methyltransferase